MKKLFITKITMFIILILFPLIFNAQRVENKVEIINRSLKIKNSAVDYNQVSNLKQLLHLSPSNKLEMTKSNYSNGINHTRYQQFVKGIPVEGAVINMHKTQSNDISLNGKWLERFEKNADASLTKKEAIDIAIKSCGENSKFYWQLPHLEKQLKETQGESATYYPKAELVWYDKKFSNNPTNYSLAYEIDVNVYSPVARYKIYIDAKSGRIINKYNNLHHTNIPGKGTSFHHGEIKFVVDSLAPNKYLLDEKKRHGHSNITTYDASKNFQIVLDENNIWGEDNEQQDRSAIEAHWGAELTIDYFHIYHNRKGMDNNGRDININVHVEIEGQPMANAYYDGQSLNFGDGDSQIPYPFSVLSIASHEFVHGVTESEANLIYEGESGAINESMSDIFAVTVEYFMNNGKYNWEVGEELDFVIRVMNDPKSVNMPSTYGGQYWFPDGDVHFLSAIGNLWYALLVDGGSGTNDNGHSYFVKGMGFEKAAKIVYETLTNYLTETSDYSDFRNLSIEVAQNLYGKCSEEYKMVSEAWYAVGVGEPLYNNDFKVGSIYSPVTSCSLNTEIIKAVFTYKSCVDTIKTPDSINVFYSINDIDTIKETIALDSTFETGDTIFHEFNTPADLTEIGNYKIKVWLENPNDGFLLNDTSIVLIENKLYQNEDLEMVTIKNIGQFYCHNSLDGIVANLRFLGCDSLKQGSIIPVDVTVGNTTKSESLILEKTLYYRDSIDFKLKNTYFFDAYGNYDIKVEVKFPDDPDAVNNVAEFTVDYQAGINIEEKTTFENNDDISKFNITREEKVKNFPIMLIERNDDSQNSSLIISGGDAIDVNTFEPIFEIPESQDKVWDYNHDFITNICKCVDASEWNAVFLDFEYSMKTFKLVYDYFGIDPTLFCNMRLKIDNEVISPTYHVDLEDDSYKKAHYDLSEYAGKSFNLCFETQNIFPRADIPGYVSNGDDVELDNIYIGNKDITSPTENLLHDNLKIAIFPNPANDLMYLYITTDHSEKIHYDITDINGISRHKGEFQTAGYRDQVKIDIENLKAGVYFMKVLSSNGIKVIPVTKIND